MSGKRHRATRRDNYSGGKKRREDEVAMQIQHLRHAKHRGHPPDGLAPTPPVIEIDGDAAPESVRIREPDR